MAIGDKGWFRRVFMVIAPRLLLGGVLTGALSMSVLASDMAEYHKHELEKAMQLKPDIEHGKQVFKTCSLCHSDDGWGMVQGIGRMKPNGYYPQLAGQHPNVVIKQLSDIREGNRDNPTMYPFTLDKYVGGPQGVADVTAYIATLKRNPDNEKGFGRDLAYGERLYKDNCVECHGEYGEGSNEKFHPRIQGQNYTYLLRQMQWIRDGKRRNANEKMVRQIHNFTHRDIQAVIDYVSRLPDPPKDIVF
ncbi:MAG: c-type cytochrome [Gammaproteobacteria bacterium]|nr:c-type cytochrome [Gammaproteobacteria bacterium]